MKERGIIFSAPMVRALLAGTKTQTRRALSFSQQPPHGADCHCVANVGHPWHDIYGHKGAAIHRVRCPYGAPGDRLWVREAFGEVSGDIFYRADPQGEECFRGALADQNEWPTKIRWSSPIHMPRWASRITLEITGVRVERLQDISEAHAMAEGITGEELFRAQGYAPLAYRRLWESLNGAGSWGANPWVWVLEFRRLANA